MFLGGIPNVPSPFTQVSADHYVARKLLIAGNSSAETCTVNFNRPPTLAERLTVQAGHLRSRARNLPPETEQIELLPKIRQAETALQIDEWLASKDSAAPSSIAIVRPKKRASSTDSHGST